ncbi:acylphosphatase [Clostridium oceanicum]|uniref:Acylphosphatase n=1 Tax=Clostridium oceanicum TaxID=1543 RepID=A0ABN1JI95_9CLOT
MNRYLVNVYGKVQGVGFRYFTYYIAKSYKLTGWVKNCDDGSVAIEIQGKGTDIEKFLTKIRIGTPFSKVKKVDVIKIDIDKKEKKFNLTYY